MGPIRGEARWVVTRTGKVCRFTLNLPALAWNSVCQRIVTSCRRSIFMNVALAEQCPKIRMRHRPADRSDTFTERYRNGRGQG
jgi:hypothetical protein